VTILPRTGIVFILLRLILCYNVFVAIATLRDN